MADEYVPLKVILPVTSIGVFLTALDGSIVNVTLPVIASSLRVSMDQVVWVVIAYLLTLSSLMGLGGALGDTLGRKKVFQAGMLVFGISSLMCSFAPSLEILVVARIIQAIGAVGIQANGLALVITYIDPRVRGRAIGINTLVVASAISTGPVLGGVLSDIYGWPAVFVINGPIALIGIFAVQLVIKETEGKQGVSLDYPGVIMFATTILLLIVGLKFSIEGNIGFLSALVVVPFIGTLFVRHETSHPNPVLSIGLMKNRQIMFGAVAAMFCYIPINAVSILLPFYFNDVKHESQTTIGLYLVVVPVALTVTGPVAGILSERFNTRKLATLGAVVQSFFVVALARLFLIERDLIVTWQLLTLVGLMAAFLSLFTNANGTRVMNASRAEELSTVSGVINLSRNLGFVLGSSLSPALFSLFKTGSSDSEYVVALGWTFAVLSVLVMIGSIFSYFRGETGLVVDEEEMQQHHVDVF